MGFIDSFLNKQMELLKKYAPDISIKCENCGANITGKIYDKTIKCEYCGCFSENKKYVSPANFATSSGNGNNLDDDIDDDLD